MEEIEVKECGSYSAKDVSVNKPSRITFGDTNIAFTWDFDAMEEDDDLAVDKWITYKGAVTIKKSSISSCFYRSISEKEKWMVRIDSDSTCHTQYLENEIAAKHLYTKINNWIYND